MADAKICGRFAPSPSGRMHLGPRKYILRTFGLAERTRSKRQHAPAH